MIHSVILYTFDLRITLPIPMSLENNKTLITLENLVTRMFFKYQNLDRQNTLCALQISSKDCSKRRI